MKDSISDRIRLRLLRALVALLGSATLSASAATYYVDNVGGDDGASGLSPAAAWKTVAKVNGVTFNPGDELVFKRGCNWAETLTLLGSGTAASPIKADCYDASGVIGPSGSGALPIISGASGALECLVINQIQDWTVTDLEIDNGENASVYVRNWTLPVMNNITLDHLTIRNTGTNAWWAGIFCDNNGASPCVFNNLTISNCDVQNVGENGIYVESNIAVQTVDQASNPSAYYSTNVQITGNNVANTHSNGIIATGCKDVLISGNTVTKAGAYNNTYGSDNLSFVGIFPVGCYGGTIEYNTVSYTAPGGDSEAFDLDEGNAGTFYYQYNFTHDNYDGFFEDTPNSMDNLIPGVTDHCIVRFNVSANDNLNAKTGAKLDTGTYVSFCRLSGSTHEFYYNTFYCAAGAPASPTAGANGLMVVLQSAPGTARYSGAPDTTTNIWKDNIFYAPAGIQTISEGTVGNILDTFDHNCFYSSSGGMGTNQLNADPQFLDPSDTTNGLQLALTSPAVNLGASGVTTPSPQVDFYNYAYDLGTTLGAAQLENVMYFPFDGNLTDASGHANNGSAGGTGNTFPTSGMFAGSACLSLNGSGYVSVANSTSTGLIDNQLCVDLWVKLSVAPSGYRRLVDKMTPGGSDGFYLDLTPTNTLRFNVRGYQITTTGTVPDTGVWTHIVGTYQSGSSMAVYINGALDTDLVPGVATVFAPGNTLPFHIGADNATTPGSKLTGELDNIRIERSTLAPSDPLESTNVMLFPFDGNALDSGGNGNTGTLVGTGTTFPTTSPAVGSASLSLNGSGYVTVANSTSTALIGNDLGIDLWVKRTTSSGGYQRLVDKMTPGGTDGFYLDIAPSGQLRFNVRGHQVTTTGTIPTTGVWTHVVATYQANVAMAVYINGAVDPTGTATPGNLPAWASTNTWPFHIGADNQTPTAGSLLVGQLDNVEIWRASDFFLQH